MERKLKMQCQAALLMIDSSKFHTLPFAEQYKKITNFFTMLLPLRSDLECNKLLMDRLTCKWKNFHCKLCGVEGNGEYLSCFLGSVLHLEDAFVRHWLFVFKTVVDEGCTGNKLYEVLSTGADLNELIRALKENCQMVPTKIAFKYLHLRVLPAIFAPETSDEERLALCDLVLSLPMGFAAQFMHADKKQKFKHDVIDRYIPCMYVERPATFHRDWQPMCCALIHYAGRLLHVDTQLQNGLLKIIEDVFKHACASARCAAFDCWRTLIDNYALQQHYLTHCKQAALLLKPLRSRFSRQSAVVAKRFDTYVYLLRTLRFAPHYLEQFLADAFGPFEEEPTEPADEDMVRHFRELPRTLPHSTEILLKALRHDGERCASCAGAALPISDCCGRVKQETANWQLLVHAVRLCAQVHYLGLANGRVESVEAVTKCLWTSLLAYLRQDKFDGERTLILQAVQLSIADVIQRAATSRAYYDALLSHVLASLVQWLDGAFSAPACELLVLPTVKELLACQHADRARLPDDVFGDSVANLLHYCKGSERFLQAVSEMQDAGGYRCQLAADTMSFAIRHCVSVMGAGHVLAADGLLKALLTQLVRIACNECVLPQFLGDAAESKALIDGKAILLIGLFNQLKADGALKGGLLHIAAALLLSIAQHDMLGDHVFFSHLLDVLKSCIESMGVAHGKMLVLCTQRYLAAAFETIAHARSVQPQLRVEGAKLLMLYYHLLDAGMYQLLGSLGALLDHVDAADVPHALRHLIMTLTGCEEQVSERAVAILGKMQAEDSTRSGEQRLAAAKVTILSEVVIKGSPCVLGNGLESPSRRCSRGSSPAEARHGSPPSASPTASGKRASGDACAPATIGGFGESAVVPVAKEAAAETAQLSEAISACCEDSSQPQSCSMEWGGEDGGSAEATPGKAEAGAESSKPRRRRKRSHSCAESPQASDAGKAAPPDVRNDVARPRNKRRGAELRRLRIDCVGGDGLASLPPKRPRRLRDGTQWAVAYALDRLFEENSVHVPKEEAKLEKLKGTRALKSAKATAQASLDEEKKEEEQVEEEQQLEHEQGEQEQRQDQTRHADDHISFPRAEIDLTVALEDEPNEAPVAENAKSEAADGEAPAADVEPEGAGESPGIIPPSQECNVTVNLFRLPHYSPTKKELEEARSRNEKASLKISPALMMSLDLFPEFGEHSSAGSDEMPTLEAADAQTDDGGVLVADLDTVSLLGANSSMRLALEESVAELAATPTKGGGAASSLEASPVTRSTPSRTKELLDSTLDISPIRTAAGGAARDADDGGAAGGARTSPDLFGPRVGGSAEATEATEAAVVAEVVEMGESNATLKSPGTRSAKLLNLIGQPARMSPVRAIVGSARAACAAASSPKTDRIRKMMLNCADSKAAGGPDTPRVCQGDVLEFGRAVPSPLALPKSSILKRKMPDTVDDGFSPCPKRKRVNFSDPPTTCEKVYFKVVEEKEKPIALRKKKRLVTRLLMADGDAAGDSGSDEEPPPGAAPSLRDGVNGLAFDGVAPLDCSPTRAAGDEQPSGRVSPLPSNPAPEVLGQCLPTSYEDLFPSADPPAPEQESGKVKRSVFEAIRSVSTAESYVMLCLDSIPISASTISMVEKWLKEHKEKHTQSHDTHTTAVPN